MSSGPNSSPAKSPFSTVSFHAQSAQIPNSPPTQAKFESPLISSLSPPLCRMTTTKTTVALHHRTGATSSTPSSTAPGGHRQCRPPQPTCLTDTDFHRIRCASPTPSPTSPGLLHRAHRRTSTPRGRCGFTNGLVHRIIALHCHSRSAFVHGQPTPAHHP
jgi:hypothetical protein